MIPFEALEGLAQQYGYIGFFLAAFLSSTIIPFSVEALLFFAIGLGMGAVQTVFLFTVASTLGGLTTYLIGFSGGKILGKKIESGKINRYKKAVDRGGPPMIFLAAFTPLPYELFSLPSGLLRMNIYLFLISTAAGRALRFSLIVLFGRKVLEITHSGNWGLLAVFIVVGLTIIVLSSYFSWKVIKSGEGDTEENGNSS